MKKTFAVFLGIFLFFGFFSASAAGLELYFFYSPTCPHCAAENVFLDQIEGEYPDVIFHRFSVREEESRAVLKEMAERYGVEKYIGLVPMTFVGEDFFLGFDAEGIGGEMRASIERQVKIEQEPTPQATPSAEPEMSIPFLGNIYSGNSLPFLTIVLGIADGFNVCSLGALILILGLVLVLKSRKKILLYGGIFILTTGVVYGLMLVLWYHFFELLGAYMRSVEIIIGIIGLTGAAFFLRQFYRFRKYGPMCDSVSSDFVTRLTGKVQKMFERRASGLILAGGIFLFAFLITLVEFPCSAAIPLMYTGILSEMNLAGLAYVFYIIWFIILYMLDELIVFLVAVWKFKVWFSSPKITTWVMLIEAVVLGFLGIHYLF